MKLVLLLLCVFVFTLFSRTTSQQYQLENLQRTSNGYTANIRLLKGSGPYGNDISLLRMEVFLETENRLRLRIKDASKKRWEVPNIIQSSTPPIAPQQTAYSIEFEKLPFSFRVVRNSDSSVIFNSKGLPFVFSDQYISLGTTFSSPSPALYGLGEHVCPFRLDMNNTYTLFNKDDPNTENKNLYGSIPFYLDHSNPKGAYGVFLLNSNAMDVITMSSKPNSLQYKVIGGIIDLYFFMGPLGQDVIQQYQQVVGTSYLPPYWSLGWMQSRYGYPSLNVTKSVVAKYKQYGIPLEVIFNDIDYMDAYKDFTFDPINYPEDQMKQFADELHANKQHYVLIVDPGIKVEPGYQPYDEGIQKQVFIVNPDGTTPTKGRVWPGICHFPDFSNPDTQTYWNKYVADFLDRSHIDGLWIDMNEPSNFDLCTPSQKKNGPNYNNPPYVPGGVDITKQTLCLDTLTKDGIFYNTHNLYGHLESAATQQALVKATKKRQFILTRSNFPGTQRYASHWTGDNNSSWRSMKLSIGGVLNHQLFGMAHVGADICGFMLNTTFELCARWTQLGSFYPFARNHNDKPSSDQEPWVFGDKFIPIIKNALATRYQLLPYLYTQLFMVNLYGGMVWRPLFMEFPDDKSGQLNNVDTQFMFGPGIMVSPVVEQGKLSVDAYFPSATWYNFYTGKVQPVTQKVVTLDAPLEGPINVHVKGGSIIPLQRAAMTTAEVQQSPLTLLVAPNTTGSAAGELFLDDGVSVDTVKNGLYTRIVFRTTSDGAKTSTLESNFVINAYPTNLLLEKVVVYGVANKICTVSVNGKSVTSFTWDTTNNVLIVQNLSVPLNNAFSVSWQQC